MNKMTIQECYESIGADYNDVISRLPSEKLVIKFALKFITDPTFESLCKAMADENYNEVFRAAHTMKGVAQNLSFTKLYEASFSLTEAVRDGKKLEDITLLAAVEEEYRKTVNILSQFKEEQEAMG